MSSYLWRYYLENDAERFQRLLQGSLPGSYTHGTHRGKHKAGLASSITHGTPPGNTKSVTGKQRSSPPVGLVLTKQAMRGLDAMGRSLLHLACTEHDRSAYVTALLASPLVDPSLPDLESGWTSLHRALYHGNISAARHIIAANPGNWSLVKVKDHAGDTPFDVFSASIHDIESLLRNDRTEKMFVDVGLQGVMDRGDEVFTWGSNKNLTLGFSDGDDRSYPERVSLHRPRHLLLEQASRMYSHLPENQGKCEEELIDAKILFSPMKIVDVALSKFHSAILTSDPHSNLFICGFGHGGRLGFGDGQNTQFRFRPLASPLLPKKRVARVALGMDHTVAVLEDGELWTWGGNRWGQLGYALQQQRPKEEPMQLVPRQVFGLLKRERVLGCAASNTHTAVFTVDSLYTFGKNDGQLGILDSSDARTLAAQSTPRKVAANFLNKAVINEVVCCSKATAVLINEREVWILAGHSYSKLLFPTQRPVGLPLGAKNTTRYDSSSNQIRKITGNLDMVCVLSATGNVFVIDIDATLKERSERGVGKVPWVCQQAWSMRKGHMVVTDVSVGAEGNVVICTQSGSVWRRMRRAKIKEGGVEGGRYKFDRIPGLTRITMVRSNSTGGFAAIRQDADILKAGLEIDPPVLWDVIGQLSPFGYLLVDEDLAGREPLALDDDEELDARPKPHDYDKVVEWLTINLNGLEAVLKSRLQNLHGREFEDCDTRVSTAVAPEVRIPAHSVVLSRSTVLRNFFLAGEGAIGNLGHIWGVKGRYEIVFRDLDLLTVVNFLYFTYHDMVVQVRHRSYDRSLHYQRQLFALASSLKFKPLVVASSRSAYDRHTMHLDFKDAYYDTTFFHNADMVLDLANGESLRVHSILMYTGCPFFSALYGGGSSGRWLLDRKSEDLAIHVDMTHIRKRTMEFVVSWLYYDWGEEGFDNIRDGVLEESVDVFLDFVLEVLSLANELMLGRLLQICQKVLGRYVNTRNAASLLNAVSACSEKGFKQACLQYMCLNLETMLENHLLDELEEDLLLDLDATVKANQLRCYPNVRSEKQRDLLLVKYPNMEEELTRAREALIAHYVAVTEEVPLPSSWKNANPHSLSSSPQTPHGGRRRAPKAQNTLTPDASPSAKSVHGHQYDIFAMDEDVVSSTSLSQNRHLVGRADKRKHVERDSVSPVISPVCPSSHDSIPATSPRSAQAPWGLSRSAKKLDMKQIMEQATATASGKSALTAGLSKIPAEKFVPPHPKLEAPAPLKLSQKERKRQQQQQQSHQEQPQSPPQITTAMPGKSPWKIEPSITTPSISLKSMLEAKNASPPQMHPPLPQQRRTISVSHKSEPTPTPSYTIASSSDVDNQSKSTSRASVSSPPFKNTLQEIIDQEEAQKELIKEYGAKRSLQEIQEEQEFLRWWDAESLRVQAEESEVARAQRGRGGGGNRRGGSRGRGRRRGRAGRGDEGVQGAGGKDGPSTTSGRGRKISV